jgi:hypothetical protein
MFFLMAGYNANAGMGFWTILNVCFAAWVFRGTAMPAAHGAQLCGFAIGCGSSGGTG